MGADLTGFSPSSLGCSPATRRFRATAVVLLVAAGCVNYLDRGAVAVGEPEIHRTLGLSYGGMGLLLIQMAKMIGARVIGTVGTDEKALLAKETGADDVVVYTKEDFVPRAKGVHVVYDSVGKATFMQSLDCLRPRGMMVTFGNASGPVPEIAPLLLSQKGSLFLTRPTLLQYVATPDELAWRAGDVLKWIVSGKLKLMVDKTYALADAADAHRDLEGRKTTGSVVLLP